MRINLFCLSYLHYSHLRWDSGRGMSHRCPYLHKAERTVGTLLLGARYRPLWLRSLQRRQSGNIQRHIRCYGRHFNPREKKIESKYAYTHTAHNNMGYKKHPCEQCFHHHKSVNKT